MPLLTRIPSLVDDVRLPELLFLPPAPAPGP